MSRTSAYGTDYYRVVYTDSLLGVVDGPYTSEWMARRVGNSTAIKWKIQRLAPVFEECACCLTLEWQDVES